MISIAAEISKIRPITVEEVKKKIKTLRSQYSAEKSYRWSCLNSGLPQAYISKLWCYNLLSFLEPHIKVRSAGCLKANNIKQDVETENSSVCYSESELSANEYSDNSLNSAILSKKMFENICPKKEMEENNILSPNVIKKRNKSLKSSKVTSNPEVYDAFGKYVASELRIITDKGILLETKDAIQGILNDARIMILNKENTLF
ncbi:hypothetical protein CDAR_37141 [Caerostris darwini]|uniref:MADF domain-containing protein n=1 Tax=Caerostris darwini TaxID=1538125 RepID=A0AAV4TPE9_9ARAC|nr:hypothetical protein CDAR_37141 [Caerostris darwini]